jgi:hypothetical protein
MVTAYRLAALHVRHLWVIAPISSMDDVALSGGIIKACTNLINLACRIPALEGSITSHISFRHTRLKHLTLMQDAEMMLNPRTAGPSASAANTERLLAQITHLRIARAAPRFDYPTLKFSSLTHLSYDGDVYDREPILLGDMPVLEQVIVTIRTPWVQNQGIEVLPKDPRVYHEEV